MATRSMIGVMHGDICKAVYCHWDGYLSHNGHILFEHYDSPKANHLVSLGDISSLGEEIGEAHPFSKLDSTHFFDEFDEKYGKMTTFYGRDYGRVRNETDCEYKVFNSFAELVDNAENSGIEYIYIMKDNQWYYTHLGSNMGLTLLTADLFETESVA